ncbi:RNA-binding protein [Dongia soli]|uniref:RNA-binding protein n=1 Tax=Dongia soli TaxID=600628 RepID=A0ABU5E8A8_9PROT|nr:RNA-binding protein [Dongia soli]MDY0881840.1 RNA-binding protein [Dongia soli]
MDGVVIGNGKLSSDDSVVDGSDGEMSPSGKSPSRRCIVTRQVFDKRHLLRFVLDPDGQVVPDVKNRLPGRGFWVQADRAALLTAIKTNAFAKAARRQVGMPADLVERVTVLLQREVAELLGLARKSGDLTAGYDKVEQALRAKQVAVLVQASDGAEDGRSKLARLAGSGVEIWTPLTVAELAAALGRENPVHVALKSSGIAERLSLACRRLAGMADGAQAARKTE